jgi:hypothetical protein
VRDQQPDLMSLKLWNACLDLERHPRVADLHIGLRDEEPTIHFVYNDSTGATHNVQREIWELETLATGATSADEIIEVLLARV